MTPSEHPICMTCGQRMVFNVPCLGADGGYTHCFTGKLLCDPKWLGEELNKALDALRVLHDYQNGPPLEKYEKQWNQAMTVAENLLAQHNK